MAVKASIKYLNHGVIVTVPNPDGSTEVIQTSNRFKAVVDSVRVIRRNLDYATPEPVAPMGEPYDNTIRRATRFNQEMADLGAGVMPEGPREIGKLSVDAGFELLPQEVDE